VRDGSAAYWNTRRVRYGDDGESGWAQFVPVCSLCGRYVRADETIDFQAGTIASGPNGTCSKDGRVRMLFEGFM